MLSINNFLLEKLNRTESSLISEKLKINSKTKVNESLIDEIIEMWGVKYYKEFYKNYYKEVYDILETWISDNNVKKVKFYCTSWGKSIMKEHKIPQYIIDEYATFNSNNEYIYDYLKDNPDIVIDIDNIFIDKDRNTHGIYVVTDHKHIISFNVEGYTPRICHKEN